MSDTDGMVRLMEHAADQLDSRLRAFASRTTETVHRQDVERTVAAIALAKGVLLMVACSASGERRVATREVVDQLAVYHAWAEEADDATPLSDVEIASVGRFLRSRLEAS